MLGTASFRELPCWIGPKPRVHFIHGIRANEPRIWRSFARTFKKAGFTTRMHWYGTTPIRGAPRATTCAVKRILPRVSSGDVMMGHSHGAHVIHQIAETTKLSLVILFQPALPAQLAMPENVSRIHLYYAPTDRVLWASKFLPRYQWGEQGRYGFIGEDERYTQFNCLKERPPIRKHQMTDWLIHPIIVHWAPRLVVRTWLEICPCQSNS